MSNQGTSPLPTDAEYSEFLKQLADLGCDIYVADENKYNLRIVCPKTEKPIPIKVQEGTGTILESKHFRHQFDINIESGIVNASQRCQNEGLSVNVVKGVEVKDPVYTKVDIKPTKPAAPDGFKKAN